MSQILLFRLGGTNYLDFLINILHIKHFYNSTTKLFVNLLKYFTGKQSLVVFSALTALSQAEIAPLRKPTVIQQMVSRHLKSAGWYAIKDAVEFYEHNA